MNFSDFSYLHFYVRILCVRIISPFVRGQGDVYSTAEVAVNKNMQIPTQREPITSVTLVERRYH